MTDTERSLTLLNPPEHSSLDSDIVVLPPEYEVYQTFYLMLRPGTFQVIDAAEALLREDPEIPDPITNPGGHYDHALKKYGVYGPIPEMAATLGYYHLAKLRLIAASAPDTYSPGFKPPALKHFLGLNDPAEALLHCAELLVKRADDCEPLRPAFQSFPIEPLRRIRLPLFIPHDLSYRDSLTVAAQRFDRFMADHARQILDWQKTSGIIDATDLRR